MRPDCDIPPVQHADNGSNRRDDANDDADGNSRMGDQPSHLGVGLGLGLALRAQERERVGVRVQIQEQERVRVQVQVGRGRGRGRVG